jgi:hypothetical protein
MARAVTNRESLAYVKEVTWGTTPASALQLTRVTAVTPKQDKQTTESQEITGRRAIVDKVMVQKRGGLVLPIELSSGVIDDFAETLFGSAWATDELTMGNTRKSVTLERQLNDIAKFFQFRGAVASKFDLNIALGRILTGSWEFMSKFPTTTNATVGTGAATAAPTGTIMNPISHVQLISEGGVAFTATEASLSIVNGVMDFEELGDENPKDFGLGEFRATGKISLHLQDAALFTKYDTHVNTALAIKIGGASSASYQFDMAQVRLTAWDAPNQGKNGKIVQTFEFEAIDDATDGPVKLTRVAA